jgi:hypothetical protein
MPEIDQHGHRLGPANRRCTQIFPRLQRARAGRLRRPSARSSSSACERSPRGHARARRHGGKIEINQRRVSRHRCRNPTPEDQPSCAKATPRPWPASRPARSSHAKRAYNACWPYALPGGAGRTPLATRGIALNARGWLRRATGVPRERTSEWSRPRLSLRTTRERVIRAGVHACFGEAEAPMRD